jgi:hypothetical protein
MKKSDSLLAKLVEGYATENASRLSKAKRDASSHCKKFIGSPETKWDFDLGAKRISHQHPQTIVWASHE